MSPRLTSTPFALLLFLAAPAPHVAAQVCGGWRIGWQPTSTEHPGTWSEHAGAFHVASNRVILFGGQRGGELLGRTWTWDGQSWVDLAVAGPSPRRNHAMAYDAATARIVLFGGIDANGRAGDTWEFDGAEWLLRATAVPSPRDGHALAFDYMRNRVVLFGGDDGTNLLGDAWSWDSAAGVWRLETAAGPPRSEHGMAYYFGNPSLLILGGNSPDGPRDDTWQLMPNNTFAHPLFGSTTGRVGHSLVCDPVAHKTYSFGGFTDHLSEDFEVFQSGSWRRYTTLSIGGRRDMALVANDGLWLFGGMGGTGPLSDLVRGSGNGWSWQRNFEIPARRQQHTMNGSLLFGGVTAGGIVGDAWWWRGSDWQPDGSPGPSPRAEHAAVGPLYPSRFVIFGGRDESGPLGDTWTYSRDLPSGLRWVREQPLSSPAPRYGHALTSHLSNLLLFGGRGENGPLGDTWIWDLSTRQWAQVSPAHSPAPRYGHAMVPISYGVIMLFGGRDANGALGDTWTWDGTDWTLLDVAGPSPRYDHELATYPGGALLYGGTDGDAVLNDTWTWDGSVWYDRHVSGPPRSGHQLMPFGYDGALIFGGAGSGDEFHELDFAYRRVSIRAAGYVLLPGETAVLTAHTVGAPDEYTYRWFFDDDAIVDDGRITGAETFELTIRDFRREDAGLYRLDSTDLVCNPPNYSSELSLFLGPMIKGDANCDGYVDNGDIDCFIQALLDLSGEAWLRCARATNPDCTYSYVLINDMNVDGIVDNGDIDVFINCLLSLPPPTQPCP